MFVGKPKPLERAGASLHPIVPLEWLLCHPSTFSWWGKSIRAGLGAAFITDPAIALDDDYEGVITFMKLIGHSNVQGANAGINWQILVNNAPVFRTTRTFGAGSVDHGFMDDMGADDGAGDTWGDIRVWVEVGGVVAVTMNNNGGGSDAMGWILRGYAFPTTLREEWLTRGWRK
jgi:hypothetical protein